MKTTTYKLPAHWASVLINGDASGLSDDEDQALAQWLNDVKPGYCLDCNDEPEFTPWHDAREYALAGDCLTFTFQEIAA